jgi:hypothetical protein
LVLSIAATSLASSWVNPADEVMGVRLGEDRAVGRPYGDVRENENA